MKPLKRSTALLLSMIALISHLAQGQSTFQNLGFESASPVLIPGNLENWVQFDSAFPGWVGYVGGVQQAVALSNSYYLDSSGISIIDTGWPHYLGPTLGVISGNYTALLQAGFAGASTIPADTTLSQTSLVPVSAESLRFRASTYPWFSLLKVQLGGQDLTFVPLASGSNFTLFGADIRAWQGQVARLDFTAIAERPHVNNHYIFLDSIVFSTQPIPEPGVFGLIGLGALFCSWRLFSKSKM